ncbi:MAG: hypothetical protein IPH75_06420 [bacterium]|nr:hypothetical protein [bacterium]
MKKMMATVLVVVFAASFLVGALITETKAAPPCRIVCNGLDGYRCCKVKGR